VDREINVAELYQFSSSTGKSSYEVVAKHIINVMSPDGTFKGKGHEITGKVTVMIDKLLASKVSKRTLSKRSTVDTATCDAAQTKILKKGLQDCASTATLAALAAELGDAGKLKEYV
jgi:hypothetical protein